MMVSMELFAMQFRTAASGISEGAARALCRIVGRPLLVASRHSFCEQVKVNTGNRVNCEPVCIITLGRGHSAGHGHRSLVIRSIADPATPPRRRRAAGEPDSNLVAN